MTTSPRTTSRTSTSTPSSACSTASAGSPSWSTRRPQLGMDSMAITDHGALYGAVAFYQAAEDQGHQADHRRRDLRRPPVDDRQGGQGRRPALPPDPARPGLRGYQNLCRLVTDAHIDGYYYKPRIDREHLAQYSEGLIGLSACLGGEVAKALEVEDWELARQRRRRVRRHLRQGPLLPRAPGPRPARAAPAQRAAAAARAGGRPAAGRHQRPPLRPRGPVRGARRPALRRDRQQPRHAEPDEVRDARVLREVGGPDGGALPGPARGDPQHAGGSPR